MIRLGVSFSIAGRHSGYPSEASSTTSCARRRRPTEVPRFGETVQSDFTEGRLAGSSTFERPAVLSWTEIAARAVYRRERRRLGSTRAPGGPDSNHSADVDMPTCCEPLRLNVGNFKSNFTARRSTRCARISASTTGEIAGSSLASRPIDGYRGPRAGRIASRGRSSSTRSTGITTTAVSDHRDDTSTSGKRLRQDSARSPPQMASRTLGV